VVGLGQPFTDYNIKVKAYYDYLVENPIHEANENDIVLLMDAYDVLVFPQIRKIDQIMMNSRTPIVFCSEAGIHLEFSGLMLSFLSVSVFRLCC
jgi:hypothetical protein